MKASVSHTARPAHRIRTHRVDKDLPQEVPGTERLHGRSRDELADAMTWLAWYAPGIYSAVLDYMDACDGDLPAQR